VTPPRTLLVFDPPTLFDNRETWERRATLKALPESVVSVGVPIMIRVSNLTDSSLHGA
jgi:hypothetical protein